MSGVKEQGEEEVDSNNNTGNEPRIYGGAEISDEALKVLSKDPSYMILDRIDLEEVRVEIEKALTKARWEWMNSVLFDNEGDEEINNEDARIEHSGSNDSCETTLNYCKPGFFRELVNFAICSFKYFAPGNFRALSISKFREFNNLLS